jgi:hypothetical protein
VCWEQLDSLPKLTGLRWQGDDRGLSAALAARPLFYSLTWLEPPTTVDLSATNLTDIHLDGDQPAVLRLPSGVRSCRLSTGSMRSGRSPEVYVAEAGRHLRLTLVSPEPVDQAGDWSAGELGRGFTPGQQVVLGAW